MCCLGLSNKHTARKIAPTCRNSLPTQKPVHSSLDIIVMECEYTLCSVLWLPRSSASCLVFRSESDPVGQKRAYFGVVTPTWKLCTWQCTQDQVLSWLHEIRLHRGRHRRWRKRSLHLLWCLAQGVRGPVTSKLRGKLWYPEPGLGKWCAHSKEGPGLEPSRDSWLLRQCFSFDITFWLYFPGQVVISGSFVRQNEIIAIINNHNIYHHISTHSASGYREGSHAYTKGSCIHPWVKRLLLSP